MLRRVLAGTLTAEGLRPKPDSDGGPCSLRTHQSGQSGRVRAAWRFGWRLFVVLVVGTLAAAVVVLTVVGFIQGEPLAPLVALFVVASVLTIIVVPVAAVIAVVVTIALAVARRSA